MRRVDAVLLVLVLIGACSFVYRVHRLVFVAPLVDFNLDDPMARVVHEQAHRHDRPVEQTLTMR